MRCVRLEYYVVLVLVYFLHMFVCSVVFLVFFVLCFFLHLCVLFVLWCRDDLFLVVFLVFVFHLGCVCVFCGNVVTSVIDVAWFSPVSLSWCCSWIQFRVCFHLLESSSRGFPIIGSILKIRGLRATVRYYKKSIYIYHVLLTSHLRISTRV